MATSHVENSKNEKKGDDTFAAIDTSAICCEVLSPFFLIFAVFYV